jgi:hypothetical protein
MPKIDVGKTTAAILAGEMDLSAWDEEELMRGQRKNKHGRFQGRAPKVVPKSVHDELVRRKMSKAFDLLRDNIVAASEVLVDVAKDPDVDPSVRLKAAGMILDRVLGKAPENVNIRAQLEPPWLEALRGGIVSVNENNEVIEAVSWEDDEDAPDDAA